MEIRRIFSLLSPVKSRIAVLSYFIGKLCLFYTTVDQQEADQSYTIILHIGHYCKEIACSVYHFFEFVLTQEYHLSIASTGFTHNPPFSLG
jgi:hypothetical protein